jgi:alpha-galactosidase
MAPSGKPAMTTTADPVIVQRTQSGDAIILNIFNTGEHETDRLIPWKLTGRDGPCRVQEDGRELPAGEGGVQLTLGPHQSRLLTFRSAP